MGYRLYGFMIGDEIHFDIANRRLYRLTGSHTEKSIAFASIYFNETMLRLFLYLLQNGRTKPVSKEELFEEVWEAHNLSPSTQRLWQVLHISIISYACLACPTILFAILKGVVTSLITLM